MISLFRSTLLLGCLVLAGLTQIPASSASRADEKTATSVTTEQLKEMLDDLGYEPKTTVLTDGRKLYTMKLDRDGWNFTPIAQLSPDHATVWFTTTLVKLPERGKVRTDALEKVLGLNFNTSPSHFVVRNDRWLAFHLPMSAKGLTATQLRVNMDAFLNTIRQTHTTWRELATPNDTSMIK